MQFKELDSGRRNSRYPDQGTVLVDETWEKQIKVQFLVDETWEKQIKVQFFVDETPGKQMKVQFLVDETSEADQGTVFSRWNIISKSR